MTPTSHQIIELLARWRYGDSAAVEQLIPLVYDELRRVGHRYMKRERPGHTLQTTALVNEAYSRLVGANRVERQDRAHFFAIAAPIMRHLLVDSAPARQYAKRRGAHQVSLDVAAIIAPERETDLLALGEAFEGLSARDERKSKIAEMRYFRGLSAEATA